MDIAADVPQHRAHECQTESAAGTLLPRGASDAHREDSLAFARIDPRPVIVNEDRDKRRPAIHAYTDRPALASVLYCILYYVREQLDACIGWHGHFDVDKWSAYYFYAPQMCGGPNRIHSGIEARADSGPRPAGGRDGEIEQRERKHSLQQSFQPQRFTPGDV